MSSIKSVCVIGSGPAGIAAAKALLSQDVDVLMIDPGIGLEKSISNDVSCLKKKPASEWSSQEKEMLKFGVESSGKGVKEKLLFGSNFASREIGRQSYQKVNTSFYTSLATRGLANIWGAGILPMYPEDMAGWPIKFADLEEHYKNVLSYMPLSGGHDHLEELFPVYSCASSHNLSSQAMRMLDKMGRHADELANQGFYFGKSRLAGHFQNPREGLGCQYCGMCLYGCPYGIIYSGQDTLADLRKDPRFKLQHGLIVKSMTETSDRVEVHVTDIHGKQIESLTADRVYLACGAFSTSRIMLETMKKYNISLKMKTSDQYYQPFLSIAGSQDIQNEELHTMSQVFWGIKNKSISPYLIHSSVYTYNDLYYSTLKNIFGSLSTILKPAINQLLGRLSFAITYLHSDHSATLDVRLNNNVNKTLSVIGEPNPISLKIYSDLIKYWSKNFKYTGQYPVPFYNGARLPGSGNHNGGCFPMSKSPKGFETDLLGRVSGLSRIHIVDSSVFPTITATTLTLSVMANSYRIASTSL